ncbi:MAG TPA: class F sortase [Egibacteraceae bacterium]|nr:class F sortase [Egibacteraceae bacterium]
MSAPCPPQGRVPPAARPCCDRAVAVAGVLTIVLTVMAMGVWFAASASPDRDRVADPVGVAEPHPAAQPVAEPASVRVASLGIEADTIALGKRGDGSLELPENAHTAGWWTGGAHPGERGASVIVGHVDSRNGPGAFFGLSDIGAGERLTVQRADGSSVHFRVGRVETHPKDAFPTQAVYGHTDAPTLRLITCAGRFDRAARSYKDNVIVFADLEVDEADIEPRAPAREVGGPEGSDAAGALAVATSDADGHPVPIALATLSVIGTAAAITGQSLRSRAQDWGRYRFAA